MTKRFRRLAAITSVVIVLLVGARMAVAFHRFARIEREFKSVQAGQARSSVLEVLGTPNYRLGECGTLGDGAPPGCTLEYVYSYPLAPLVPNYYVVYFSANERVVDTAFLSSP